MTNARNRNHGPIDVGAPGPARRTIRAICSGAIAIGCAVVLAVAGAAAGPVRAPTAPGVFTLSQARRLVTGASAGHLEARTLPLERTVANEIARDGVAEVAKGRQLTRSIDVIAVLLAVALISMLVQF